MDHTQMWPNSQQVRSLYTAQPGKKGISIVYRVHWRPRSQLCIPFSPVQRTRGAPRRTPRQWPAQSNPWRSCTSTLLGQRAAPTTWEGSTGTMRCLSTRPLASLHHPSLLASSRQWSYLVAGSILLTFVSTLKVAVCCTLFPVSCSVMEPTDTFRTLSFHQVDILNIWYLHQLWEMAGIQCSLWHSFPEECLPPQTVQAHIDSSESHSLFVETTEGNLMLTAKAWYRTTVNGLMQSFWHPVCGHTTDTIHHMSHSCYCQQQLSSIVRPTNANTHGEDQWLKLLGADWSGVWIKSEKFVAGARGSATNRAFELLLTERYQARCNQ